MDEREETKTGLRSRKYTKRRKGGEEAWTTSTVSQQGAALYNQQPSLSPVLSVSVGVAEQRGGRYGSLGAGLVKCLCCHSAAGVGGPEPGGPRGHPEAGSGRASYSGRSPTGACRAAASAEAA